MRHTLRSDGLLRLEASYAKVSQSDFKIGGCVTMGGACGTTITEVTLRSN
jgi:hypothetical protein